MGDIAVARSTAGGRSCFSKAIREPSGSTQIRDVSHAWPFHSCNAISFCNRIVHESHLMCYTRHRERDRALSAAAPVASPGRAPPLVHSMLSSGQSHVCRPAQYPGRITPGQFNAAFTHRQARGQSAAPRMLEGVRLRQHKEREDG